MSNKLTLKTSKESKESKEPEDNVSRYQQAAAEIKKLLAARPGLTHALVLKDYIMPLIEASTEDLAEYIEDRLEDFASEIGVDTVGDEDLNSRASAIIANLGGMLDSVLLKSGVVDADGNPTKICPPEVASMLTEVKSQVQAWSEDYAAYLAESLDEDDEDDEGEEDDDDGTDDEPASPAEVAQVVAGGIAAAARAGSTP